MNEEYYDFSIEDSINSEINKQVVKESEFINEERIKSEGTTVKPVMRRTYPKSIIDKNNKPKNNSSHVVYEETGFVQLDSKDYITISSEAINYLFSVLTSTEHQRFSKIQPLTKTSFNIVFNGQYPHSASSLKKYLGLNTKQLERFIRKLTNKGILYVMKGYSPVTNRVQNTYIINPFISRKRKQIDKRLLDIFVNVSTLSKQREQ